MSELELVERFRASMSMDLERWREGTGYALELLAQASELERRAIESLLLASPPRDWRHVEALAALGADSAPARAALRRAFEEGDEELRGAVRRHAPELVGERERAASLADALATAVVYGGLTQALLEVEDFTPPEVHAALWRGLVEREGEVSMHFAALLCYLHGAAAAPFDLEQRPRFLRFHTEDRAERERLARELKAELGV